MPSIISDLSTDAGCSLGSDRGLSQVVKTILETLLPSPSPVLIVAGGQRQPYANPAFAKLIGVQPTDGLPIYHCPDVFAMIEEVFVSGEPLEAKGLRLGKAQCDLALTPIREGDQEVAGVLCLVSRRPYEAKAPMRALADTSGAGLVMLDLAGKIASANAQFCQMVDLCQEAALGRDLRDFIDPRYWQEDWLSPLSTGSSVVEVLYHAASGKRPWVAQTIFPIPSEEGGPLGLCLLTNDISKRRSREDEARRLAGIVEGSDDAILAIDFDMRIRSWNAGAEKLYGYTAAEAIGQSIRMILPDGNEAEEVHLIQKLRHGERMDPYETRRQRKDGSLVPVSLSVSPILDGLGDIVGISKIARDISAQKEAERIQTYLLYEMKHRVKNILATVLALARQTFGKLDLPEYTLFKDRIYTLSRVQDLLTREARDSVLLGDLVAEVLTPYPPERFEIHGKRVILPAAAVVIVTLALHELATNALKYGALSQKSGRVVISWDLVEGKPDRLRFSWSEVDGPQISPPSRKGFGTVLIRDLLSSALNAQTELRYPPEGLRFTALVDLNESGLSMQGRPPSMSRSRKGS